MTPAEHQAMEAEYARRFKAQIVSRLTANGEGWSADAAMAAAESEWEAFAESDGSNLNGNPENDADEAMTYWDDDGDEA